MGLGIWIRHEYGHGLDLDEGWAGDGSGMSFRSGRVGVVYELHCMSAGAQEYLSLCATNELYITYNTN